MAESHGLQGLQSDRAFFAHIRKSQYFIDLAGLCGYPCSGLISDCVNLRTFVRICRGLNVTADMPAQCPTVTTMRSEPLVILILICF